MSSSKSKKNPVNNVFLNMGNPFYISEHDDIKRVCLVTWIATRGNYDLHLTRKVKSDSYR